MKTIISFSVLIFFFAFAEGQTSTIKVKKNTECDCPGKDTTMSTAVDFVRGSYYKSTQTISFSGKVSDTLNSKPLPNVRIWYLIDGKKNKVISNKKGEFVILNAPLGVYSFYVSYPCYNLSSFYLPLTNPFAKASIYLRPCRISKDDN